MLRVGSEGLGYGFSWDTSELALNCTSSSEFSSEEADLGTMVEGFLGAVEIQSDLGIDVPSSTSVD